MTEKRCTQCGGPFWERWEAGADVHDLSDCVEFLQSQVKSIRNQTIRDLDARYNTICEKKIDAAIEQMDKRVRELEDLNKMNADSIRRGREQNLLLREIAEAASYCLRHGHIDEAAIIETGLDSALNKLEAK